MMYRTILYVALGSALGGVLRYGISLMLHERTCTLTFPYVTLGINIFGCLLLGFFTALIERHIVESTGLRLLLTVGLCGGFTTFSTFALEGFQLGRTGHFPIALTYMMGSMALGIIAIYAGYYGCKALT